MILPPFLLYLGNARDPLSVKSARGVAQWRPGDCLGELSGPDCEVTLNLPQMSVAQAQSAGAKSLILGEAMRGGRISAEAVPIIIEALEAGLQIVSGLHQPLRQVPEIEEAANRTGGILIEARQPPPNLPIGTGEERSGRRLLTVGTDCSVGKMYAALAIEREMRARGMRADFRATGQTGIFIAGSGIAVDAVVADFISGAVERLSPARDDGGWDVIEGQGSLFHPSYAGVSLGLLHGAQPDAMVMCHEPNRAHMRGLPGRALPEIGECLAANLAAARLTHPEPVMVGVALNTSALSEQDAIALCDSMGRRLGLPCTDPVRMGVAAIVEGLQCFAPS